MRTIKVLALAALLIGTRSTALADGTKYEKGEALLRQVAARYASLESMTAEVSEEWRYSGKTIQRIGRARLQKPNLAGMDYTTPNELNVWDGTRVWRLKRDENRFYKSYADKVFITDENPLAFFFYTGRLVYRPVAEYAGTELIEGEQYQMVDASMSQGRERLFIGPDLLVHRITGTHNKQDFVITVTNLSMNLQLDPSTFIF